MNQRTPVPDLELQNSGNLARAKARPPEKRCAKRAEMEALFADLTERRKGLLADVKANGLVIEQDKFSARGELYLVKIANPALKILQTTERQLVGLARLLTEEAGGTGKKSTAELLRELDAAEAN